MLIGELIERLFDRLNQEMSLGVSPSNRPFRTRKTDLRHRHIAAQIEYLEQRAMLSAQPVLASHLAHTTFTEVSPAVSTGPSGYTPSQIQTAYSFNQITSLSGPLGSGQTIAIVDAYDAPTIKTDLHNFDLRFGLADPPNFTVVGQTGSTSNLPGTDPARGWEVEEALDVEWAHALAPAANIVLVEANSPSDSNLFAAVDTAASWSGVSVVSLSWGGGEFFTDPSFNSHLVTPSGHQGVTFLASTGDNGAPGGYPAYSPNVVAVGGTSLNLDSSGNYISESGWSGSGGGVSIYESQPAYQSGVVTQSKTRRTIPDVSFDADPNTGVPVLDSFTYGTATPWDQIGGTSFSAPAWASIIAISNQARVQNGLKTLDGVNDTLPMLYKLSQTTPSDFTDITSGYNGFSAGKGYDLVTGIGSPVVNKLVSSLSQSAPTNSHLQIQLSQSTGTAGVALGSVSVSVVDQNGILLTNDSSQVTIKVSSGPGAFDNVSTTTVTAVNGVASFSNLVLDTAGVYQLSASDNGATGATSGSITIGAAQASQIQFGTDLPKAGTVGLALAPFSVLIEDKFNNLVTTDTSTVTIGLASGPGSLASSSTLSVNAIGGIATFKNIAFASAGVYTISASDTGLTSATSGSINVQLTNNGVVLSISATSSNSVSLSWTSATGAQGYRLFYFDQNNHKFLLKTFSSSVNGVTVIGLVPGKVYSFQIQAYRGKTFINSNLLPVNTSTSTVIRSTNSATLAGTNSDPQSNHEWW